MNPARIPFPGRDRVPAFAMEWGTLEQHLRDMLDRRRTDYAARVADGRLTADRADHALRCTTATIAQYAVTRTLDPLPHPADYAATFGASAWDMLNDLHQAALRAQRRMERAPDDRTIAREATLLHACVWNQLAPGPDCIFPRLWFSHDLYITQARARTLHRPGRVNCPA